MCNGWKQFKPQEEEHLLFKDLGIVLYRIVQRERGEGEGGDRESSCACRKLYKLKRWRGMKEGLSGLKEIPLSFCQSLAYNDEFKWVVGGAVCLFISSMLFRSCAHTSVKTSGVKTYVFLPMNLR